MGKEVAILGGGVAGLATAKVLEDGGNDVTVINKPGEASTHHRSVYTTFQGPTAGFESRFESSTLMALPVLRLITDTTTVEMSASGYAMVDYPRAIKDLTARLSTQELRTLPSISLI